MDDSTQRHRTSPSGSTASSTTSTGITLIGVLVSIGSTVGFGFSGLWSLPVVAGCAMALALAATVEVGTLSHQDQLACQAAWIQNSPL